MALLGFKKRFVPKIRRGTKQQTIRTFRKYPISPGETLYLYTALRTKYAEKIKEVICDWVYTIDIKINAGIITINNGPCGESTTLKGTHELDQFAKRDGFANWQDMKAFWIAEHGVKKGNRKVILTTFRGMLITWSNLKWKKS